MKTALVLGANGNFGSHAVQALLANNWQVRIGLRPDAKSKSKLRNVSYVEVDPTNIEQLDYATQGVDVVVYALNPPYTQWREQALSNLEHCCQIAEQKRLHILFPGNVYGFRPQQAKVDETVSPDPRTEKGEIRVAMEQRLKQAALNGAKVTIVRAGDFIGRDGQWFNMIFKPIRNGWRMSAPHSKEHCHYWSYLPDLCANAVSLIERQQTVFEVFHDPGVVATQTDWHSAFAKNQQHLKITRFPWWLFRMAAPFSSMLREVLAMRYLWQETLILEGGKWQQALGDDFQATSIEKIVEQYIESKVLIKREISSKRQTV